MPFPQSFLDELIARNDIVDVVGSYVSLTPKGGSFWGCCPFHNEKTPSFHVLPDRQFYHCFGCKKGGGVINFIMDIENLSYPDAVRFLAKRANIPVPEEANDGTEKLRRRMLELNRDAARWYYQTLQGPDGQAVRAYLDRRRIHRKIAVRFGMGAAPDSSTTDYVIRQHSLDDIVRPAVRRFAGEFIRRRLRLEYQPLDHTVVTDGKWLGFVVEQVLSNALKYTARGSVTIAMDGDDLCIRDTGMGIAAEDLPRIFEQGFTGVNGRRDRRASGIGLYLCRRICGNLGQARQTWNCPRRS